MIHKEILERVWTLLERGAANRKDNFHTPALGTLGLNDSLEIRTVVLREVLREARILMCHVDRRSPKVAEIERNERVSWLFYQAPEKLQLRVRGRAKIYTDGKIAEDHWQNSELFSRRCYCGEAPGTIKNESSSGLPQFLVARQPTIEESELLGRKNFAVLSSTIDEIDVYELNVKGHRRSLFTWDESSGELKTRWLTP